MPESPEGKSAIPLSSSSTLSPISNMPPVTSRPLSTTSSLSGKYYYYCCCCCHYSTSQCSWWISSSLGDNYSLKVKIILCLNLYYEHWMAMICESFHGVKSTIILYVNRDQYYLTLSGMFTYREVQLINENLYTMWKSWHVSGPLFAF